LLNQFPLDYVDKSRAMLIAKYPTLEAFKRNFDKDHTLINEFTAYAETKNVKKVDKDLAASSVDIEAVLHASVARNLYTPESYYEVINTVDKELQKALEVIKSDDWFKKNKISF
jgi:carboxyl-terminal processing protease